MKRPFSVRARLTLWYTAVLGVSLALFAVAIWLALRQAMLLELDHELDNRAAGFARFLAAEASTDKTALVAAEASEYAAGLFPGQSVRVWDYHGRLIYAWPPEAAAAGSMRSVRRQVLLGGRLYPVELATALKPVHSTLRKLALAIVAAIPLVLLLAAAGGWWMSRRAMAPVDAMTRQAHALGIRNLRARLPVPASGDELARLAEAWNGVLGRLQQAMGRLTRFTADASHELRNPVAIIRTTAELTLRRTRSEAEYRQALSQIEDQSRHITCLIDDLLALARSDHGPDHAPFEIVDLSAIIRDVCDEARPSAERKQISLSAAAASPVPLPANLPMLRRLAVLLVDNALKYTGSGGEVTVSAAPRQGRAILEVSDTGCGISAEELPHIFERFWRARRVPAAGGAGLGLALAKAIVDLHKGGIGVRSEVDRGSVFEVSLPAQLSG